MKKNDRVLKIAHFLQNNRQSKKRHKTQKRPLHNARFVSLRAFRSVWFVPFKTRAKRWGENDSLRSFSLFLFFSCEKRRKLRREHCEKSTNHHQNTVIYHHVTQREHLTRKRDLSQKKHGESGETGAHFRRGARVLSHRFSLKSFSSFRSSFFFSL